MSMNVLSINEYQNQEDECYKKIFTCSIIIGLLIVVTLVFLSIMHKDLYYEGELYVIDNDKVVVNVLKDDLKILTSSNTLIINNYEYFYNIQNIEIYDNYVWYYKLELKLSGNFFTNSFQNYKILKQQETLFQYIIRVIKSN